jgi:Family of unknown function (DUF6228)
MMEAVAERFVLELPDDLMWAIDPPVDPYADSYVHTANVEIRAHGLTAETTATVEGTGERDLADFFADLACDWRGWTGERSWRALEGEMAIEAWHDGRANVMITVTIKRPWMTFAKDAWSVRAVFTLEAGEQLSGVARDLATLLDGAPVLGGRTARMEAHGTEGLSRRARYRVIRRIGGTRRHRR